MNRIMNRIFTEHSKIIDIYCQAALHEIPGPLETLNSTALPVTPETISCANAIRRPPGPLAGMAKSITSASLLAGRSKKSYIPFFRLYSVFLLIYFATDISSSAAYHAVFASE
jgi:hypothetical protein